MQLYDEAGQSEAQRSTTWYFFQIALWLSIWLSSAEERKIEKLKYLSPPWVGYKTSAQQAQ